MLFNSLEFACFLVIVFFLYWFLVQKKLQFQNILLIVASYVFYGWWDWRFLILIFISSTFDYLVGIKIDQSVDDKKRKSFLFLSLTVNLGILFFFKYYNFFADNFVNVLSSVGMKPDALTINVILPVGLSFYTFQSLSYTIDIYKRRLKATTDPIAFFAFVSFFPQLVAGPIERAVHMLPQFTKSRVFDYSRALDGVKQMVYGLFKKIVIADSISDTVDMIYNGNAAMNGAELTLGTLYFAIQIYCDFSGYSDIAIGCARLFGFELMANFRMPYFSKSIGEFWTRWHISLSSWFRDYVYIPLGGSRAGAVKQIRNLFITFILSGLWHGANWTFIVWGFAHALFYMPEIALRLSGLKDQVKLPEMISHVLSTVLTFTAVCFAWIFFRANSITDAFDIIHKIVFQNHLADFKSFRTELLFIVPFMIYEFYARNEVHGLSFISRRAVYIKYSLYILFPLLIILFSTENDKSFIYFQF